MRWILSLVGLMCVSLMLLGIYRKGLVALISKSSASVWSVLTCWRSPAPEMLFDPMNGGDAQHNVGYVSRWALAEFGVECTRCGEPAAARLSFHRIRVVRLPDGITAEVIDCPLCHTTLVASGTTEKLEDKLDTTDKRVRQHLSTFARKRHALSPVSPMEAHTTRQRLKIKDLASVNPLDHIAYAEAQAQADKPSPTATASNTKELTNG